jgi:peroxiredoxin
MKGEPSTVISLPPQPGEQAPDFTLPSTAGADVTLSSYRGSSNVLLAFFPLAFTDVCTVEMCDFTGGLDAFRDANAEVLGISVDSIPTLNEFKRKHGIAVDLLSDFRREVCRRYGTLIDDLFFSQRAYIIIDKRGVVRWMHVEEEPGHKRDNVELLAQLAAID